MSDIVVKPCTLGGRLSVPPSKSAAHRAIICASLAKGKSILSPVELSDDISATINCMKKLGAEIEYKDKTLYVDGTNTLTVKKAVLDCGESGSTLRFLIPAAAVGGVEAEFVGHGRLPQRPVGIYLEELPKHGVLCKTDGGLPLTVSGRLGGGTYSIPGNVSSQFVTGLLLSLALIEEDSEIIITTPLQSKSYIAMTVGIMRDFGVTVSENENGYYIKGNQKYTPRSYTIEGDWSQAAFFMTAAALGGSITIDNLNMRSQQGDKACIDIYKKIGADITYSDDESFTITKNRLNAVDIDASDIPDMIPALCVVCALCEGTTTIRNAQRLRIKESDRLLAMQKGLSELGADIKETEDGLIITGVKRLHGGMVSGCNDHRIVMSLAVAACACDGDITISDRESINKSYPSFFEDFMKLGGVTDVKLG